MRIRVWGCRGSLTTPGPATLRYGGNSTCLEIRTPTGQVLVVDAGSGARNLGKALSREPDISEIRFLFSHSHSDHLVGFPFFEPAYSDRYSFTFCSGTHSHGAIKKYLSHQMEAPYFPVDFSRLRATFHFQCQRPHNETGSCCLGGLQLLTAPLSHPNGGYGFRFMEAGKSFVFLTDNELGVQRDGGLSRDEYIGFCQGADLLFHDAQYTDEEYQSKRGWGHSTFADATDLAIEAGVTRLGLIHHDPDRTDDDLDHQVDVCRRRIGASAAVVECFAVAEGMTIDV